MSGFLQGENSSSGGGSPTGSAGGDLGGSYPNPTVQSVAHVTAGILPAANQAAQTMGGDVTGTTAASVVSKIQGITISGTPQDGYVLVATSPSAAIWQSISSSAQLYSNFFALQSVGSPDNPATIAVNAPILFPRNGPSNGAATSLGAGLFNLPAIGDYEVTWQASISEAGQLALAIGGVYLPDTVVGRAALTSQIVGSTLITTTVINSVLSVINAPGNSTALTITPIAGGVDAVSSTLTIKFLG